MLLRRSTKRPRDLAEEGFADDEIDVERSLDMKYIDQVHECRVDDSRFRGRPRSVRRSQTRSTGDTRRSTRTASPTTSPELINIEVNVYGRSPGRPAREDARNGRAAHPHGGRPAYFAEFGEYRPTPLFDGNTPRGALVDGPAIVEEETTTIVVFPGWTLRVPRPDLYVMRTSDYHAAGRST